MTAALRAGLLLAAALCAGHAGPALAAGSVDRLVVLDCGSSRTHDLSANWTPGAHVGESYGFGDHCYLIEHGARRLLWDAGIADAVAELPDGLRAAGGLLTLRVRHTLAAQLKSLGIAPESVTDVAFSHFHSDHVGNANLFTAATHYVQRAEAEAAFGPEAARFGFNPALYERLAGNPTVRLDGDWDVFGDASVVILATPGHTPGHQSLLVRLPHGSPVILSGDLVHLQENWDLQRVPARNFDRQQSLTSMRRVQRVLAEEGARLWINHDAAYQATIPGVPAEFR